MSILELHATLPEVNESRALHASVGLLANFGYAPAPRQGNDLKPSIAA
jgi:hypothetical protein